MSWEPQNSPQQDREMKFNNLYIFKVKIFPGIPSTSGVEKTSLNVFEKPLPGPSAVTEDLRTLHSTITTYFG